MRATRRSISRFGRSMYAIIGVSILVVSMCTSPAWSCSRSEPPRIEDIVPGGPLPEDAAAVVVGVYEQKHLAVAPGLVLVGQHTVSVVTRYWGVPPPNTSLVRHGNTFSGLLAATGCGDGAGWLGLKGYAWVDQTHLTTLSSASGVPRDLPSIDISVGKEGFPVRTEGVLTPEQETLLTESFGPPVVILIGPKHIIAAYLLAWRDIIIELAVFAGIVVFVLRRRSKRRQERPQTHNPSASSS